MAIELPSADNMERVAPQPSRGVASYQPGIVEQTNVEIGRNITAMADAELERINTLKTDAAETSLMQKEQELRQKYMTSKGGDVLTPEFHNTSQSEYKDATSEISSGLSTPAQKAQFARIAQRRAAAFDAGRINYAMGESDKFEVTQHNARIQTLTDQALSQYANPSAVADANTQLNDEIVKWGIKQGMSTPEIAAAYHKAENGNFYSALIEHALTNNDTSTANTLYAASSGMLSEAQRQTLSARLKVGNDYTDGQGIAVEAQKMMQEGKPQTEIAMYVAKNAKTPGAYSAAQSMLANFQQANAKAQAEAEGSVLMMYHKKGVPPAQSREIVRNSPEFLKLTPTQQAKTIDYMDADVQQHIEQGRASAQYGWSQTAHMREQERWKEEDANRKEVNKYKSPEARAAFYIAVTDPNLVNKSSAEIWGLASTVGAENVSKILSEHDRLVSGQKPLKIDESILESVKPPSLFRKGKQAENASFNGYVTEALMDWQDKHPGKTPTADEQRFIAASANTEYTISGRLWGENTATAASPEQGDEYNIKRNIIKSATSKGRTLTKDQIDQAYKSVLKKQGKAK